jgi:hypothetical protein
VLKLKASPPGAGRKMVVELWLYPDGTRILELSTKCAPDQAFQVAAEAQTTKTRKSLELFSAPLRS